MTTDELKALEAKAKDDMKLVASVEDYLQEVVERAMKSIKAYHAALGVTQEETELCVVEGCPNIGDYERSDGEYVCQDHFVQES